VAAFGEDRGGRGRGPGGVPVVITMWGDAVELDRGLGDFGKLGPASFRSMVRAGGKRLSDGAELAGLGCGSGSECRSAARWSRARCGCAATAIFQ